MPLHYTLLAELNKCMEKILKVEVPLTSDIMYLGKGHQGMTNSGDKNIFRIMLVASKKVINKLWWKMEDWIEVMHDI